MDSWFTLEKIDDSTYSISEYGHPEHVHSYLLIGSEAACLIDTGLGIGNIREAVLELTSLPVKVITTHAHWDHIGGHGLFGEIYIHHEEADWLRYGIPRTLEQVRGFVLEEPITKPLPAGFDLNRYYPFRGEPAAELKDMDTIDIGGRELTVLHTPGHSPGHLCVYEESRGYLYTGDLIYKGMLYAHLEESVPEQYYRSVKRVCGLPGIKKVLTAHNETIIESSYLQKVLDAFGELEKQDRLKKGAGLVEVGDCKILL